MGGAEKEHMKKSNSVEKGGDPNLPESGRILLSEDGKGKTVKERARLDGENLYCE